MITRKISSFIVLSLFCIATFRCHSIENDSYRLPNNSYPLKYDLWLKVNVENKSTFFRGNVKIHLKLVEESDAVTVHVKYLKITKLFLIDLGLNIKHENVSYKIEEEKNFLIINLPQIFIPGSEILLDIQYYGELIEASDDYNQNKGLVIATYKDLNEVSENYIFTHFEPIYARESLPCYDEPAIRAPFSLRIEHHSSYTAIGNMPIISQEPSNKTENYVITSFQETPKMQVYLLAFVVTKMKYLQNNDINLPQKIYARSARIDSGDVNYIEEIIDKILKIFEDYFGISYSLPKLDHFIAPHFYTAIENWGIVGYSERYVFDIDMVQNIRTFLHEIAHQYFGNLVAPKWWSYAWLNEGFAKFFDVEFASHFIKDGQKWSKNEYLQEGKHFTMGMERYQQSKSLSEYVEKPDDIKEKFSAITYYKGAAIIQMFQKAFGSETFRKGLSYYLKANQLASVDPSDLHKALQQAVNEDYPEKSINVEDLMTPWEVQCGFPTVKVSLENDVLKLSQSKMVGKQNNENVTFTIPITFSTSQKPDFDDLSCKFWMTEREYEIGNFSTDWIILNNQQVGYYEVDYDINLWNKITDQLHRNYSVIHYLNRQFLSSSLISKLETKNYEWNLFVDFLKYLKNEDSIYILTASQQLIRKVLEVYRNDEQEILSNLKDVFEIIFERMKNEENSHIIKNLACKIGVESCLNYMINSLLVALTPKIDYNYPFCQGLRYANETIFDTFYDIVKSVRTQRNMESLFIAFGCVENVKLFRKALNIFIDPEWINIINPFHLLSNMNSREKQETFLDFLEENHQDLRKMRTFFLSEIVSYAKFELYDEEDIQKLEKIEASENEIKAESIYS